MRLYALWILVIGTCAFAPNNTTTFEPPAHYREVFDSAVACSGYYKPYSKIDWHAVPGKDFRCDAGRCIGEFFKPHSILIAEEWRTTDWVVKHEILHYITGFPHDNGPRDTLIWGKKCQAMWGFLPNTDPNYRP